LKNLQQGLQARFDALPPGRRKVFNALVRINMALTKAAASRHQAAACSSKFMKRLAESSAPSLSAAPSPNRRRCNSSTDLGIPVANGYGLTEAARHHGQRFETLSCGHVGKPLPGMEVRIVNPASDGVGEVSVRSKTVMAGYLNEPKLTAETIVDGWLLTGDLGRFDEAGHLKLADGKKT